MGEEIRVDLSAVIDFQNQKKWTDSNLAMHMGVSKTLVSRVKSGKRNAASAFIQGLVRAGMNPKDIFLKRKLPHGKKEA